MMMIIVCPLSKNSDQRKFWFIFLCEKSFLGWIILYIEQLL